MARARGDPAEALRLNDLAQGLYDELKYPFGLYAVLYNRALIAWEMGDYALAKRLAREIMEKYSQVWESVAPAQRLLALAARAEGDLNQAEFWLQQIHPIPAIALYDPRRINQICFMLDWGSLFSEQGKQFEAACVLGGAEKTYQQISAGLEPRLRHEHDLAVAAARSALGEKAFVQAWQAGLAMTFWQVVEYIGSQFRQS